MDYRFLPNDDARNRNGRLFHLGCEATEVASAIFMIQRFGAHSRNPLKDGDEVTNPNNVAQLLLELWDLEYAARAAIPDLCTYLGDELVANLRKHWESKAYPPAPSPEMKTCPTCDGSGVKLAMTGQEGNCGQCGGSGRVAS